MIVFNLAAKGGMSLDGPAGGCLVGALATVETRSARTLVARENLMSFAPVVPKAWVLGSLLAAASPAHALVELEAVIRPSVAATQRVWFYCALGAARDLRAGIERFQTAAHIADRALVACEKGEDLYSDAILNDRTRMLDFDAASRMRAKIRASVIEYLEMDREPASQP